MSALNHAFLRAYAKQSSGEPVEPAPLAVEEDHYAPNHEAPLPPWPRFHFHAAGTPTSSFASRRLDDAHARPSAPWAVRNAAPTRFQPAWEVDQFPCPALCGRVMELAAAELEQIGRDLVQWQRDGLRTVGVTSLARQEGRTTFSICLARAAAAQGLRVLLFDADLDHPQLAAVLGIDTQADWTQVLSGSLPIEEVAVASLAESVTLAPLRPEAAGRGHLLRLGQFALLVDHLTTLADLVVVDLPPQESQGLPASRAGFASPIDAVAVVRDLRRTSDEQLRRSVDDLRRGGLTVVGVIENFA